MLWYFTTSAFYGGQEGSLLYWALMLAVFSAIFVLTAKRAPAVLVPYVIATLMGIETFLLVVLSTVSSPFVRLPVTPADGNGLNPLLMDPGMLVHPPMLLMGYMSFSLPFAFAVAAMITGKLDSDWLRSIRRWMLASWSIQTTGLILGAWWAYHVLGWGGYWGWDPVENAALMPWLIATAYLHSVQVQERRGRLRAWSTLLPVAGFNLALLGTFIVRSGVVPSVHAFAVSSAGPWFPGGEGARPGGRLSCRPAPLRRRARSWRSWPAPGGPKRWWPRWRLPALPPRPCWSCGGAHATPAGRSRASSCATGGATAPT